MEVTRFLNLPVQLEMEKGGLKDLTLLGVLSGQELDPPEAFKNIGLYAPQYHTFALLHLFGVIGVAGSYFARGKVLTVVNKRILEQARERPSGYLGVKLTNGTVRLSKLPNGHIVSMVRWFLGEMNTWRLSAVKVDRLIRDEYPFFFDFLLSTFDHFKNTQTFNYPVPVPGDYLDASAGYEFRFLDDTSYSSWGNNGQIWMPEEFEPKAAPISLFQGASVNLGGSNQSDVNELLQNKVLKDQEMKMNAGNRIESRFSIVPKSKQAKLYDRLIEEAKSKVEEILKEIREVSGSSGNTEKDMLHFTAEALKSSWTRKSGGYTGRGLFKEVLERTFPDFASKGKSGETYASEYLNKYNYRLVDLWVADSLDDYEEEEGLIEDDNKEKDSETNKGNLLMLLNVNKYLVYVKMLEFLLAITRDKLTDAYLTCKEMGINFSALLKWNPYYLCFLDPRLTVEDLDKLAMLYGVNLQQDDIQKIRNVVYMHNFMLDNNNRFLKDSTAILQDSLVRVVKPGFVVSKRVYDTLQNTGYVLQPDRLESLQAYIRSDLDFDVFALPRDGWRKEGTKYILKGKQNAESVIRDYVNSGLGVRVEINGRAWISDYVLARKEMYVYNKLRELCEYDPPEVKDEDIKRCVEAFEKLKQKELGISDFKLEIKQAEALYLIKNRVAVLTGPAGSGKTTTAEALVFAVEMLLDVKPEEIYFCAPTGKAANRLKEVVKRKTRTIHSLFQISGEGVILKDPDDIQTKDNIKVLIVDESSMLNINLMYEMLLRIAPGTFVFFLGDREQLAPIGFGKPFDSMLKFLPTVALNVTKRASEKSGITRNAKKVIYESDGIIEDLEDTDDFRIIQDKDGDSVVSLIKRIVGYHLGNNSSDGFRPLKVFKDKLNPDDIQVITPTNIHPWGTINLNRELQDVFNPKMFYEPALRFQRGEDDVIEFRLRDRVIHVKKNQTDRQRFLYKGDKSFVLLRDGEGEPVKGINNGEVGKVLGFFEAYELDFSQEDKKTRRALEKEYCNGTDVIYLAVEYSDVSVDSDDQEEIKFVILYRANIINKSSDGGAYIDVVSTDLHYVDLAYALTVHKMQGSQAPLCICVFLGENYSGFITRNMIYTSPTRAKVGVYCIGDILGTKSLVNMARKVQQMELRTSVMDLF